MIFRETLLIAAVIVVPFLAYAAARSDAPMARTAHLAVNAHGTLYCAQGSAPAPTRVSSRAHVTARDLARWRSIAATNDDTRRLNQEELERVRRGLFISAKGE